MALILIVALILIILMCIFCNLLADKLGNLLEKIANWLNQN